MRGLLKALGFRGDVARIAEIAARKAAHVFEFFVLALLVWALLRLLERKALLLTAVCGLAVAVADEGLQLLSGRGSRVSDVLIDFAGVLLALAILRLATQKKRVRD